MGQIIYREYIVFRGSNISCSLARVRHPLLTVHTAQSVIHYSPFTLHSPSSITHHSHCTVRHPLLTVHTAQSVIHYSPFTLQTPLLATSCAQCRLHYSLFTFRTPDSVILFSPRISYRLRHFLHTVHAADCHSILTFHSYSPFTALM